MHKIAICEAKDICTGSTVGVPTHGQDACGESPIRPRAVAVLRTVHIWLSPVLPATQWCPTRASGPQQDDQCPGESQGKFEMDSRPPEERVGLPGSGTPTRAHARICILGREHFYWFWWFPGRAVFRSHVGGGQPWGASVPRIVPRLDTGLPSHQLHGGVRWFLVPQGVGSEAAWPHFGVLHGQHHCTISDDEADFHAHVREVAKADPPPIGEV